ncbi:2-hydroxyacid dehydrogenase [Pseudomonas sp. RIT-PI-S]|uniref:2-hydroxyacid dehydrogenase n=1 Tax=Pseudomonas sp. RIT-PI-S TaxID=3035295 RepID=UPI0021D83244|nr:2-hydroxyacid dehydrogenase [Pseudomonas sp. RIT-PI-S]
MSTTVLVLVETIDDYLPILEKAGFHLILATTPAARTDAIRSHGQTIDAVLTRGPLGLLAEEIAALPRLQIITVIGAGYERVDLAAAGERGIVVTNGAGVNAPAVADHAMALLLAVVRDIPRADASVRRGEWSKVMRPSLAGKRLGVLGLGAVGMAIAKRAALGFGMTVGYHSRRPRGDVEYTWFADAYSLAAESDILIIATPGGEHTRKLVDAKVIAALGREGFLVNVARGSVVDTSALIDALRSGQLAGAGLDVFDDEPNVPDTLKALPNVVLTPHVAGLSPDAVKATVELVTQNLLAHFSGRPVLTPVTIA